MCLRVKSERNQTKNNVIRIQPNKWSCILSAAHLSLCRRLDVGVARLTDDIVYVAQRTMGNSGKVGAAVVGKVAVDLPGTTKVGRPFDQHGGGAEGLQPKQEI